jgi:hypothetical protein
LAGLPTEVDALKRLQAETPVNRNTGQATAELDALFPAIRVHPWLKDGNKKRPPLPEAADKK